MARRRKEFLSWKPDDNMRAHAQKVAREYRKLGGKGGVVEKANHASIKWMERKAIAKLNESIKGHGRPQYAATGKLAQVIRNDKSHSWTNRGWKFMVASKVEPQITYAYSLEYGYKGNVGKYRWFLFLGRQYRKDGRADLEINRAADRQEAHRTSRKRDAHRSTDPQVGVRAGGNHTLVADRIIGRREAATGGRKKPGQTKPQPLKSRYITQGNWVRVKIERPIPAYHYGQKAADDFDQQKIYITLLDKVKDDLKTKTNSELVTGAPAKAAAKSKAPKKKYPRRGGQKTFPVTVRKIGE